MAPKRQRCLILLRIPIKKQDGKPLKLAGLELAVASCLMLALRPVA